MPGALHLLRQTAELLERTTTGFAAENWTAAPPGSWNSAQILDHLRISYDRTRAGYERLLGAGEVRAGRRSPAQALKCWYFLTFASTPYRAKAPAQVIPGPNPDGPQTLAAALATLRDLQPLSEAFAQRFGARRVLTHPVFGPMNAAEMARFHWAHARHHMRQVRARSGNAA